MSHAARSCFWDFAPKTKGGVGIVPLGAAFGVGYGIMPPRRQRLSVAYCMLSSSKLRKLATVVIPSFPNWITVLSGIPISVAFWRKSVFWEFVKTIFNYSLFLPCRWQWVLILTPVPSFWGVRFETFFPMAWNKSPCSKGVVGLFLLLR